MKSFNKIALSASIVALSLAAPLAAETFQAPASSVVSATPSGDGYDISWSDPIRVSTIEIYYGEGTRAGFVKKMSVGGGKSIHVDAQATRFNLVSTDGRYLHLECGGNDRTTMPTLRGLKLDCHHIGDSGQAEGALVIG